MDSAVMQKFRDAVKTLERDGFIYTSLPGSTHKDWYPDSPELVTFLAEYTTTEYGDYGSYRVDTQYIVSANSESEALGYCLDRIGGTLRDWRILPIYPQGNLDIIEVSNYIDSR